MASNIEDDHFCDADIALRSLKINVKMGGDMIVLVALLVSLEKRRFVVTVGD